MRTDLLISFILTTIILDFHTQGTQLLNASESSIHVFIYFFEVRKPIKFFKLAV